MLADPRRAVRADRAAPLPRRPARRRRRLVEGRRRRRARRASRRARAASTSPARAGGAEVDGRSARRAPRAASSATSRTSSERGKPFFPYAMFHDTVMSLVVVCVIIALAVIWKYTEHTATRRLARPALHRQGRPGDDELRPAARTGTSTSSSTCCGSSSGRTSVILGTIGIPTICLMLLLALPFIDLRRERRLLAPAGRDRRGDPRRPLDGRADLEGRDGEGVARQRGWSARSRTGPQKQGFAGNQAAVPGAKLFAAVRASPATRTSAPAPPTTARRTCRRSARADQGVDVPSSTYVSDPRKFGNTIMPQFGGSSAKEQISPARRLPRRVQGREVVARRGSVRVFLGITGASGAPYAVRLLRRSSRPTARSASARRARASR